MTKKMVKKKKLKIFRLLLILGILGAISFAIFFYANTKIKNIIINGNQHLSDLEIIKISGLENYPSFLMNLSSQIEKKIEKNPWIKKATVSKSFYHVVTIKIEEEKPLFLKKENQKIVLENKVEIENKEGLTLPVLMNYVPNTKYGKLIKKVTKLDSNIWRKVSEFYYLPNEYDKDRFLLYMDDGNSVYLTLTKFQMLDYYDEVVPQLEGKKGILYLDSGNHFKIME